jgi:hypothetical protein
MRPGAVWNFARKQICLPKYRIALPEPKEGHSIEQHPITSFASFGKEMRKKMSGFPSLSV